MSLQLHSSEGIIIFDSSTWAWQVPLSVKTKHFDFLLLSGYLILSANLLLRRLLCRIFLETSKDTGSLSVFKFSKHFRHFRFPSDKQLFENAFQTCTHLSTVTGSFRFLPPLFLYARELFCKKIDRSHGNYKCPLLDILHSLDENFLLSSNFLSGRLSSLEIHFD